MYSEQVLLKLLLSQYLVKYLEISKFEEKHGLLHLFFEEKSMNPKELYSLALQF